MKNDLDLVPSSCFPQAEEMILKNSLRMVLCTSWFLCLLLCIQHWFAGLSWCLWLC